MNMTTVGTMATIRINIVRVVHTLMNVAAAVMTKPSTFKIYYKGDMTYEKNYP